MIMVYQTIILLCLPCLVRSKTILSNGLNAGYPILTGQLAGPCWWYQSLLLLPQFSKLAEVQAFGLFGSESLFSKFRVSKCLTSNSGQSGFEFGMLEYTYKLETSLHPWQRLTERQDFASTIKCPSQHSLK